MASAPILEIQSTTQQQPTIRRVNEKAGQTFLIGVPVMVDITDGGVKEWDTTTITNGIAGISKSTGANLATTGTAQQLDTKQAVPNQPLARVIPFGAPLNDGRTDFATATQSTVFSGQVGPTQTVADTDITKLYGISKDTDGSFYVDKNKSATATVVVQIVRRDFWDKLRGVHFVFIPAAIQQLA